MCYCSLNGTINHKKTVSHLLANRYFWSITHECLLISLFSLENMCSLWNYAADIHSLWKWSELFMFILRMILVKRLNLKTSYELVSKTIAKKHSNSPSQMELNSFDGVHFSLDAIHYFIMQADACNNRNGVVSVTEWSARVHVDHHHTMRERERVLVRKLRSWSDVWCIVCSAAYFVNCIKVRCMAAIRKTKNYSCINAIALQLDTFLSVNIQSI